jgi:RecB family exonuclease
MHDFLHNIAQYLHDEHGDAMQDVVLVFPNKRAGLFFRQHLASIISKPVWEPEIQSLEEFLAHFTELQIPDQLTLILELFDVYLRQFPNYQEAIDRFYYWGEMLIKDFDDLDNYLIDTRNLFYVLFRQKEMDLTFLGLSDEQIRIIELFWKNFGDKPGEQKQQSLLLWEKLPKIYEEFNEKLRTEGLAYKGALVREVASHIAEMDFSDLKSYWFVGFNALSPAEEAIISTLNEAGKARIFWDADDAYVNPVHHEAGHFIRKYQRNRKFADSFPKRFPNRFVDEKIIHTLGVPMEAGQCKKAGELLKEIALLPDFKAERTVVVLPNEGLLVPMLQAIPPHIKDINVTMGFPIRSTSAYSFIELIFKLYQNSSGKGEKLSFYYKDIHNLLSHPFSRALYPSDCESIISNLNERNIIRPVAHLLQTDHPILKQIIRAPEKGKYILAHFKSLLVQLFQEWEKLPEHTLSQIEKECMYLFHTRIQRLQDIFEKQKMEIGLDEFIQFFKQLAKSIKLPFEGEPLIGLQVMGMLETRLLDFDRIIILSANEGVLPAAASHKSFIPYNLRKAFDLPTFEHQDKMAAYHFYRLIQRAKEVWAFYNTESEGVTGKGEKSRFLLQLEMEGRINGNKWQVANSVKLSPQTGILIPKTEEHLQILSNYEENSTLQKRFSASALLSYLDCRLRYYFRYIMNLQEQDTLLEEIDPALFGTILHNTLEQLYGEYIEHKGSNTFERADYTHLKTAYQVVLNTCFANEFGWDAEEFLNNLTGNNLIAYEAIKQFIEKVLDFDCEQTPFNILGLEKGKLKADDFVLKLEIENGKRKIVIGGSIDRLDEKDGVLRVLDYKTGRAELKFHDLDSLFDQSSKKRNKAVFQVLIYTLMVLENRIPKAGQRIQAGIIMPAKLNADYDPIIQIADDPEKSRPVYDNVHDVRELLPDFKSGLVNLMDDLFSLDVPWDQTEDVEKCKYCPYNRICQRQ